jgi:Outer membrane protein beta-barrel domain
MRRVNSGVFLLLLIVNLTIVDAQTMFDRRFQPGYLFGIKAGANVASQYSPGSKGVFEVKSITGINAGGYYGYFINRVLAVQVELSVSGKGSHWREYNYSQDEAKDILTYLDLPFLVRYQPFNLISFHTGPQVSYLARAMQYDYSTGLKGAIDDYYKPLDLSLVFGIEANLPKNIDLTIRYARGLISVYAPGGYNYQSFNNYFQFTAGYRFEKKMKLQSKSKTNIRRKR